MIEILQSIPTWVYGPLAVVVIGVLTIATNLYINRKKKRLWYNVNVYPVVRDHLSSRIQVSLDGEILPNVYVCAVSLLYKGTEPLLEKHFRTPIVFDFGDSQVLDVEVTSTKPNGIEATVHTDKDNKFRFDPVALNDNSRLYARVLLTKYARPEVSAHIVDVKPLQPESERETLIDRSLIMTIPGVIIGLFLFVLGLYLGSPDRVAAVGVFGIGIALLSALAPLAAIYFINIRDWMEKTP